MSPVRHGPSLGAMAIVLAACGGAEASPWLSTPTARFTLPPASPDAPTEPGPAPRRRSFDAVAVNAACERCHVDVAAEWRGSLHREAHTDAAYQHQLAREPFPFCVGCHAPEAEPRLPVPADAAALGVGCVTCHVVGDAIWAGATGHQPASTHDVLRTAAFDRGDGCRHCHEFGFPASLGSGGLAMQATMTEHAGSPYADRPCAACHMPLVDGPHDGPHRSHAFAASRDEALVRDAVVVTHHLAADGALVLTLAPGRVGHAFPTGDMLRRLALSLEVLDARGERLQLRHQAFTRHFAFARTPSGPPRRVLVRDDRVGLDGASVRLRHPLPAGAARVRYTLDYERLLAPTGGRGGGPLIDGTIRLAEEVVDVGVAGNRSADPR